MQPHGLNPNGPTLQGIDVASPQGPNFNWRKARELGAEFAWIQVSGPASAYRERNWRECKAEGILRGPYRFLSMIMDGRMQADEFLRVLDTLGRYSDDDLHPMLDVESASGGPSKQHVLDTVMSFVERAESVLGRPIVIYTYPSYWKERAGAPIGHPLRTRPLMISHFKVHPKTGQVYKGLTHPDVPATWDHWDVWQVTGNAAFAVEGVETDVDTFWGTREEFISRFTLQRDTLPATLPGISVEALEKRRSSQRIAAVNAPILEGGAATLLRAPEAEHAPLTLESEKE